MVVTTDTDENKVVFNYKTPDTVCLKFENEARKFSSYISLLFYCMREIESESCLPGLCKSLYLSLCLSDIHS